MTTLSGVAAMRATMATASTYINAGGSPASSAASVLSTGGDFLRHARESVGEISALIDARTARIDHLTSTGGSQRDIDHEREQIALLAALQDRIQQSMQRIMEILSGSNDSSDQTRAGRAATQNSLAGASSSTATMRTSLADITSAASAGSPSVHAVMHTYADARW